MSKYVDAIIGHAIGRLRYYVKTLLLMGVIE
jgi:hypothetical protein